jgi:hypothetical protein
MELIKSTKITTLLVKREALLSTFDEFYKLKDLDDFLNIISNHNVSRYYFVEEKKKYLQRVDKFLWGKFIEKCPFFEVMPRRLKKEWRTKTDLGNRDFIPEFSMLNIEATFKDYLLKTDKFTTEKIETLFKNLYFNFKTNHQMKFTKKMILKPFQKDHIKELEDVFCRILEKPKLEYNKTTESKLSAYYDKISQVFETVFFNVKEYKNGNVHLLIKDDNLIIEINKILNKANKNNIGRN